MYINIRSSLAGNQTVYGALVYVIYEPLYKTCIYIYICYIKTQYVFEQRELHLRVPSLLRNTTHVNEGC